MSAKKPHVLISAFTFPPASNGVAKAAYVHAKIMQQLGSEVDVVTAGDTVSQSEENGMSVARFPIAGKGHLLSPHRGTIKKLHTYLAENNWDIVFMHCWQAWNTNCLIDFFASKSRAEKLVLVSHGISTNSNIYAFPRNWIRRFLWLPYRQFTIPKYLRLLTELVVLWDHYDDDRFLDHEIARRMSIPVTVIPNIAPFNQMKVKQPSLRFNDEELADGFLLSVGNYSDEKNQLFVLDAYRRSRMNDIPLIFVGHQHNRYSAKLEKLVRHWNLCKVQLCERLTKEEIDWLYKHALLFLYGSKTECQPIVILDCLASETLCLTTDVGCVRSLDGVVVVSSIEEMATRLHSLLQHPIQREGLICQGLSIYNKEFCFSSVRNKWDFLLTRLLRFQ